MTEALFHPTNTFNSAKCGPLRRLCGIYAILNIINGMRYIGSSIDIQRRCSDHIWALRKNIHDNSCLQRAWNKYGEENFAVVVVETISLEELEQRETYWIKETANKYNIVLEAGRPPSTLGYRHRPESIEKMRARKGEKRSGQALENIRISQQARRRRQKELEQELGHKIPLTKAQLQHIEDLRRIHTGAKRGPATGEKLRLIFTGVKRTGQALENILFANKFKHKPHPQTQETKDKISTANTGKKRAGVALENIRAGAKKRYEQRSGVFD